MKVLFAVSNEHISESIVKKYQKEYKEIISYKNVYYFNAILKELQRDKTYDRVVISEDLEPFTHNNYQEIDKFIFDKLDSISDEASNGVGDTPIVLICTDRRSKSDQLLVKLFGIGIYDALLGRDRSIDEVCRLINRPRTKKEAKLYYQIEVDEVAYQNENENSVSELEIQNILTHYKRLGKNEERYVESFNNIAAQYNDAQLRVIIKFLPLNVKAILEMESPKYQSIMTFAEPMASKSLAKKNKQEQEEKLKIGFIETQNNRTRINKPIVVPSAVHSDQVRKLNKKPIPQEKAEVSSISNNQRQQMSRQRVIKDDRPIPLSEPEKVNFEEETVPAEEVQPKKRGRGRPRKNPLPEVANPKAEKVEVKQTISQETQPKKRGRGRPRKNPLPEIEDTPKVEKENIIKKDNILPGFEEIDTQDAILPGFEEADTQDIMLPGFDEAAEDTLEEMLPQTNQREETLAQERTVSYSSDDSYKYKRRARKRNYEFDEERPYELATRNRYDVSEEPRKEDVYEKMDQGYEPIKSTVEDLYQKTVNQTRQEQRTPNAMLNTNFNTSVDLSNLITRDKKIVTFVGTTKNGTSFLVNNLAIELSARGIKTAIFDATQNRNSYYIYTRNEENLRKIAIQSIKQLEQGNAAGINVNKNLSVFTSLPGEEVQYDVGAILSTLIQEYSVVLIDCDFGTSVEFFKQSQEIYLVQSMDVLTIQPLTAFLRDLKAKDVLEQEKIRVIINKEEKVRGLNAKAIVGGMAFYNDPAMSFMTELFNKDQVKYYTVPFDEETYARYLEGLVNCEISFNGYSKLFISALREVANGVYPVINNRYKPGPDYSKNNKFSKDMNHTLEQMKRTY